MEESYPTYIKAFHSAKAEKDGALLCNMIKDVRGYKSAKKMAPNAEITLLLAPKAPFKGIEKYLSRFLFAKEVKFGEEGKGDSFVYGGTTLFVELEIDKGELLATLNKEKESLQAEVTRGEKMLSNPGFLAKAPKEKVALEQEKLASNKAKLEEVLARLESLK